MSFIETLLLHCLQKINGERTIYSILHVLNGKKTSQTIQDIHLFQLTALFQTFPQLTRKDLETIIIKLVEKGWIDQVGEQRYQIKNNKEMSLAGLLEKQPIPKFLKGWTYHPLTTAVWERFSLLVQVASHLEEHKGRYFPVQRDRFVQEWLKEMLYSLKIPRDKLSSTLYKEIIECLDEKEIHPQFLIIRLTGVHYIGLTTEQAAAALKMDVDYYHLNFLATLHFMMQKIVEADNRFPLLKTMIKTNEQFLSLTKSTAKTYEYIQLGYSIEEITAIRQLKKNTIEDHIVEMVLNIPSLSIEEFVDKEKINQVKTCAKQTSSKSLKQLKEKLSHISYFEIRIVLAKFGDKW
ncbi:MAG: helix-turn-helix domain-containing protein [Bacillus sp. (in: firmicutes)]